MPSLTTSHPPASEAELLQRCDAIAGLTFKQLAQQLQRFMPDRPLQRKGWLGQAIEIALGAQSGSAACPDFKDLGIELKTLPLKANGTPAESTFVTTINLMGAHLEQWESSICRLKLKRVLWLPVEGCSSIPYEHRRIGQGFLWSPDECQEALLKRDWQEHMDTITYGHLDLLDARAGQVLQVRPKAASGKSLCQALDANGSLIQTLPRGFYLRASFTQSILIILRI